MRCYLPSDPCLYFNYHHVIKADLSIEAIYPSWFIIYVGFGVITVTAGNFFPLIGKFSLDFIDLLCVLIADHHQTCLFVRNMAHPTRPLITIVAAPGSLCLTGYLKTLLNLILSCRSIVRFISSIVFRCAVYASTFVQASFYPSYAAFTFPLVISATAIYYCSLLQQFRYL